MLKENAGQPGNNKSMPDGLLKQAVVAPRRDLDKGAVREGIHTAPESFSVPFNRGTTDIVILLKNGETRYFDADEAGMILASTFLTSYGREAFSVHFGESCHYVKGGKISAAVHMTRKEFFELMRAA